MNRPRHSEENVQDLDDKPFVNTVTSASKLLRINPFATVPGFQLAGFTSYGMVAPLVGPSVSDMMQLAGNILTVEAGTKQLKAQTKQQTDRQNEEIARLDKQISSLQERVEAQLDQWTTSLETRMKARLAASTRRIEVLEQ